MTRLRRYAVTAALAVLAACDAQHTDRLFAPNADLVTSNAPSVVKTKSVIRGNRVTGLVLPTGGSISIDGHTLKVPAGAIDQATWFSMQVVEASVVHVRLKAWRAIDGAAVTQFPSVPVELTLDASPIEKLDPTGLVIVYLRDGTYDGAREEVRSIVNQNDWTVTGYLTHFSSYALAREFSPGID
ncbi:MAG TPA: hypothetical protein VFZ04_22315 [Longimicrobiales bacterium]